MDNNLIIALSLMIPLLLTIVYLMLGDCLKKKSTKFGHEASVVVLLGCLLSYILDYF
jgi:hypothetical protein